jgi:predicted phosphodiesterase
MRLAALYDIHGNLPALEAVLEELRRLSVDRVIVGGDVVPGPMPGAVMDRLLELPAVDFIYGNGERAVLAQIDAGDSGEVRYWGTASGAPPPEHVREALGWTSRQLSGEHVELLRSWPATLDVHIPNVGRVLCCHGTPRSETEVFSRLTPADRLRPIFDGLGASLVVCGHTHMPCDRMIGSTRVVNAGSVGMPFGAPGADWLLIGDVVELRHTSYDLHHAAARVRRTEYPQAEECASRSILEPPREEDMARAFADVSFR